MVGRAWILRLGPPLGIVPDDLAGLQVDHLLADVRAVVGDSLERLRHGEDAEHTVDGEFSVGKPLLSVEQDLLLEAIDGVVEVQHPAGEDRIILAQGAIRIADHAEHAVGHHAERLGKIALLAKGIKRGLRDRDRAIADPLELVVHLDDGEYRSDRVRVGLAEGEQWNALLLDLDVDLVHDQFDLEYFPSSLKIMIEVAVHGVGGLLKDTSSLFRDLITKNLKLRLEIFGLFVHEWVSFLGSIRLWREDAG